MRRIISKPTKLEQIRRARGMPRYVLAMAAGVSMGVVCAWENWGVLPSKRKTIERIARVLGVEPEELLQEPESEQEVSDA